MARQERYSGVSQPLMVCPCVRCVSIARSCCTQPQLVVLPLRRLAPNTVRSCPHSQTQRHIAPPRGLFAFRAQTVKRPKRWPIRSMRPAKLHLSHKIDCFPINLRRSLLLAKSSEKGFPFTFHYPDAIKQIRTRFFADEHRVIFLNHLETDILA